LILANIFIIGANGPRVCFVGGIGMMLYPPDIKLPKSRELSKLSSAQIK